MEVKRRGRPPGSKNKLKTSTDILKATKAPKAARKPSKAPRNARSAKVEVPVIKESAPVDLESASFWKGRFKGLCGAIENFLQFFDSEADRDNVEPEYKLKLVIRSKYRDCKFSSQGKPRSGIYVDPFTVLWSYLEDEDILKPIKLPKPEKIEETEAEC